MKPGNYFYKAFLVSKINKLLFYCCLIDMFFKLRWYLFVVNRYCTLLIHCSPEDKPLIFLEVKTLCLICVIHCNNNKNSALTFNFKNRVCNLIYFIGYFAEICVDDLSVIQAGSCQTLFFRLVGDTMTNIKSSYTLVKTLLESIGCSFNS